MRPTTGDQRIKITIRITITITRRSPQQNCHAPMSPVQYRDTGGVYSFMGAAR